MVSLQWPIEMLRWCDIITPAMYRLFCIDCDYIKAPPKKHDSYFSDLEGYALLDGTFAIENWKKNKKQKQKQNEKNQKKKKKKKKKTCKTWLLNTGP